MLLKSMTEQCSTFIQDCHIWFNRSHKNAPVGGHTLISCGNHEPDFSNKLYDIKGALLPLACSSIKLLKTLPLVLLNPGF